jgi:hypothetical protein
MAPSMKNPLGLGAFRAHARFSAHLVALGDQP